MAASMTVGQFLADATQRLRRADIATARLDCLILMEDVLGMPRASLLAHPEQPLPDVSITLLNKHIVQRGSHVPLAYIRGRAAFFGREFIVNTHVLVPRPETETMIELLLHTALPDSPRIADVGTGSGCIGITAALELPAANVFLYDIDPLALQVARENAAKYQAAVHIGQQDLVKDSKLFDVVLANLPYVPEEYAINKAARFEPELALFAGKDGLDLYRKFWRQISILEQLPRHIFTEALPQQHADLRALAKAAGYRQAGRQDFIQHFTTS